MTGAPFPKMSSDPVVQFCIEEAVVERVNTAKVKAQKEAEKKRQADEFKAGAAEALPG